MYVPDVATAPFVIESASLVFGFRWVFNAYYPCSTLWRTSTADITAKINQKIFYTKTAKHLMQAIDGVLFSHSSKIQTLTFLGKKD